MSGHIHYSVTQLWGKKLEFIGRSLHIQQQAVAYLWLVQHFGCASYQLIYSLV